VRPALEARGWVVSAVIRPEEMAGNVGLVARLRMAYFGGPLVAQTIVDVSDRLPFAKAQQLFDQSIMLQMKVQEALSMPLDNGRDALELTKLYFEYRLEDKKLDLQTEEFRHQCEQDIQRQRLAEQQMTTADDVQEGRAAKPRRGGAKAA
jgi:hypothetical protein